MRFDIARSRRALAALALVATAAAVPLLGQSQEPVDLQAIFKIKDEGLQRSKVMEITSYLTDVYGPRLTGSPNIRKAGEWAIKEMQGWGLANTKLEPWGPFGRGWRPAPHSRTVGVSPRRTSPRRAPTYSWVMPRSRTLLRPRRQTFRRPPGTSCWSSWLRGSSCRFLCR